MPSVCLHRHQAFPARLCLAFFFCPEILVKTVSEREESIFSGQWYNDTMKTEIQNALRYAGIRRPDETSIRDMKQMMDLAKSSLKLLIGEETNIIDEKDFASEASVKTIAATKKKQQELFKIEQYVDMALQYMRLDFTANDFVIREICLDDVVRNAVHKYARQFVYNNLYLKYEQTQINAITDEKWLGFVIEQILSNAIKYTKSGGITIKLYEKIYNKKIGADAIKDSDAIWIEKEETLPYKETIISIEDTGIGISAEDLPRVCEMGYTGGNGHGCTVGVDGKHSTGIGLYLCKRILDKLGHKLNISSVQGKGTRVEIIIHLIRS